MANLQDRDKFEGRFGFRLGRLAARHRKELIALMGHPPDIERVPASFWTKVERETNDELVAMLLLIFIASATQHGLESDRASQSGNAFAQARAATVAKGYTETSRERIGRAGSEWRDKADRGVEPTKSDVADRVGETFGPRRAAGVAMSETTVALIQGSEDAIEATVGKSDEDIWINRPAMSRTGPCPICRPLHKTKRTKWSRFFRDGPPAHPDCVCVIGYANLAGDSRLRAAQ